jgi:hypothetical protein
LRATTAKIQITRLLVKLEKGKGVKQDDLKALKFFQKACGLNDGSGCSNLGFMYKEGKGVKQDDFNAFFIHKSKLRATNAKIQITRLLVKLDCLEIILFSAILSSWIYV